VTVDVRGLPTPEDGAVGKQIPMRTVDHEEERAKAARFRAIALPYIDDVYSLARYLLGNPADAEDATQEAFLRAFRYFDTFRGTAIKPWLFAIVRNVCRTIRKSAAASTVPLDDDDDRIVPLWSVEGDTPGIELVKKRDAADVRQMLEELPAAFREVLVLREIDALSYREIAEIVGVPVGTIMSRLARGRAMLRAAWLAEEAEEKVT
jgi:RNA polymerase sigma-70 factor (ECF subfamily)